MTHPNFLLNSRTLIIGSSSGIGYAVASGALANGAKLHITSVTSQKLSAKIAQLQSLYSGAHVSGSVADLSNTETLEANLQSVLDAAVKETGGALDHIVYTAGDSFHSNPLAELTADDGAFCLHSNPGKYLNPAASSSITLTSGILAHRPRPGSIPVIGAAGAVEALTRALAVELAPIRANVIVPGAVGTELFDEEIGTPERAAEAYLFSMRSALATGQDFKVKTGF
ncbi:hypothetical protein B0H14DRAFT_3528802 [Mycena olivaceomarginata]|nr:hypothetical protein B0H14DRAFT_3528802 [Mycena olivaceomarginata]